MYPPSHRYPRRRASTKKSHVGSIVIVLVVFAVAAVLIWNVQKRPAKISDRTNTNVNVRPANNNRPTSTTSNAATAPVTNLPTNQAANVNSNVSQTNTAINAASVVPATGIGNELVQIPTTKHIVVFTFDAGSANTSLTDILAALKAHSLTATFFYTGVSAKKFPEDVTHIAEAGHEIFNHTYDHPYLTKLDDAAITKELRDADAIISPLSGATTKPFFRAPYGDRNAQVIAAAGAAGYRSVYWTVDALDWKESEGETASQVKKRVLDNLQNGAIILMHVGDSITGKILPELLTEVTNRGYTILPLSKALANK